MRLFKCYDSYTIDCPELCLAVWADNEYEAIRKCAEIHKNLDCYDEPYEAVMNDWKAEEYFIANDCDVFICYPRDITCGDDIRIISCPFDVKDVEEYIMDQLIEIESHEEYFRDNVNDKGINVSFNERFYYDDKGWIFKPTLPVDVRDDIKVAAKAVRKSVNEYIDNLWMDNINKFFSDNVSFRDEFFSYMFSDDEEPLFFDDEFYFYVCKRLMELGDWVTYADIRRVDNVSESGAH